MLAVISEHLNVMDLVMLAKGGRSPLQFDEIGVDHTITSPERAPTRSRCAMDAGR